MTNEDFALWFIEKNKNERRKKVWYEQEECKGILRILVISKWMCRYMF